METQRTIQLLLQQVEALTRERDTFRIENERLVCTACIFTIHTMWTTRHCLLATCRPSGCTVASGVVVVVVGDCNRSQMRTSKCICLIFGVSIGLDPC